MDPFSYVANADTQVISDLYEAYIKDPNSVDTSWRDFFKGFDFCYGFGSRFGTSHVHNWISQDIGSSFLSYYREEGGV
jgi:2-oxoglutarate dehydrogenase complex dehydrogenase (E1) component-like enzyme